MLEGECEMDYLFFSVGYEFAASFAKECYGVTFESNFPESNVETRIFHTMKESAEVRQSKYKYFSQLFLIAFF